ncbi:hypothetical protein LOTGIDRAFT_159475 [Lottia gigantea]|uniref:Uncharacterized protein n=1 Tax=Lottia gigantea TaxID=225164 RepID=V4C705_LOTGI|nr:hypothetical protein LOTGIDRAFT_159475 [Lottia gigantea]ESO97444.1 hypothetical protein LOTGIDRAFT_159475 [Lottia gigantea]
MAPEHSISEKMCEYEGATNRKDLAPALKLPENDNKKCYIKIILPSQSDDSIAETATEPEINHQVHFPKLEPPQCSVTPRSESVSPTPHPNTPVPDEHDIAGPVLVSGVGDSIATRKHPVEVQEQSRHEKKTLVDPKGELAIYNRTDIAKHYPIRSLQTPKKTLLLERPKNSNFAGSFVDIGGWQDELKKTNSVTAEDILKKRSKTYPSLHSKSLCKASKFRFEHHEDLTRYIRDYRYTQTVGKMGRRLWDGSHQNLHHHNGSQRSLGVPGFRVKTTDPVARTFLPNTPRIATDVNLHGGCILCEQEKFRLRNSFPKRVFLSWSQYMTLCKSNTFMMSQASTGVTELPPRETPTTPYPTPRSVSAYSPTRPIRLLNQREKASDLNFKYQSLSERKPRQIVQRRSMPEQNSIVDKTLLVYRLSEKMRQSTSLSKLDQIDASGN